MDRLTEAIEERCRAGAVGEAVRLLVGGAESLARFFKQRLLQEVIDRSVSRHLGERRSGFRGKVMSPWRCPRCGPRLGRELRRNGHYRRRPLVAEGMITLRVPQLVCRSCNGSVPSRITCCRDGNGFGSISTSNSSSFYLEGCSYRATRRLLERRCRSSLGLMTLWRSLQASGAARHAPPGRPPGRYLALDEVHHRVRGESRWFLSIRAQDETGAKHWVGSVLSSDRTQDAWETALVELGVSRYNPPFAVISDGDKAIESAVAMTLPGVRFQRCTWHLKHNAAEWIRGRYPLPGDEGQRRGLMAAVHVIVDAPDLAQRTASLAILNEGFPWLARRLRVVLERIPPKDGNHPVRTNNLMERGFRELRRQTRQMDGFGSDAGAANFHLLWMLKENARSNGRDYLREILP